MLDRSAILSFATTPKVTTIDVPGYGAFGVRIMSGTEREAWESQAIHDGKVDLRDFRAKLLAKVLCDSAGTRLFSDDDISTVSGLPAPLLIALFEPAKKLNALLPDDVEELAKN